LRNEKIGFKIREHTLKRIPYMIVVGDREVEDGTIAVRDQAGKDLGVMQIDDFINLVNEQSGQ
jgi:threonyl-tRNA synthetase